MSDTPSPEVQRLANEFEELYDKFLTDVYQFGVQYQVPAYTMWEALEAACGADVASDYRALVDEATP